VSQPPSTPPALRRRARGAAALVLGIAAAILTACGGGGSSGSATATTTSSAATSSSGAGTAASGSAQAQKLTATEVDFAITLDQTALKSGPHEITVVNNGQTTHALAVEENGTVKATSHPVEPGQSTTMTVDLDAGPYVFYCPIDNHRAMGMQLNVTVQ
jgi:uncharacterized cupredoxin-like copper-binding protein